MDKTKQYTEQLLRQTYKQTQFLEQIFLKWTEKIDFALFCFIYSVFLIIFLRYLLRNQRFRPKNKEIISWKKYVRQVLMEWLFSLPIIKNKVRNSKQKNFQIADKQVFKELELKRDKRRSLKLPVTGMNQENLKARIQEWHAKETKKIMTGKISGSVYIVDQEYYNQLNKFASKYMYHNPLHLDTYKEVIKMQAEVLKMTASIISQEPDKNAFGVITSGGSQSLIMTLYAYKNFYSNKKRPNIVVPNSVHAAVDKGCFYFNIEIRKAKLKQNFEVDMDHLKSMIDDNTICIIGSYPNFPHGIIDPVLEMAKLGLKHSIGVHIDGCLGGFIAAFDKQHQKVMNLDHKGITSISLDHHKFGLAPKGVSTVFFKTNLLRRSMYYINLQWCGGLYGTPSFSGSRHGFASSGAWWALTRNTKKTYKQNAQIIIEATKKITENLRKIPDIKIFGNPQLCVVSFGTDKVLSADLYSYLTKEKGYDLSLIHLPDGIHISVTLANYTKMQNQLAKDIASGFQFLRTHSPKKTAETAIYGASSSIPTFDMGDEFLKVIIGATLK